MPSRGAGHATVACRNLGAVAGHGHRRRGWGCCVDAQRPPFSCRGRCLVRRGGPRHSVSDAEGARPATDWRHRASCGSGNHSGASEAGGAASGMAVRRSAGHGCARTRRPLRGNGRTVQGTVCSSGIDTARAPGARRRAPTRRTRRQPGVARPRGLGDRGQCIQGFQPVPDASECLCLRDRKRAHPRHRGGRHAGWSQAADAYRNPIRGGRRMARPLSARPFLACAELDARVALLEGDTGWRPRWADGCRDPAWDGWCRSGRHGPPERARIPVARTRGAADTPA